jgi:hypothetical protein
VCLNHFSAFRTLFLEVWGFKPSIFTFEKKKKILGKVSPFFEKILGIILTFFGLYSANLTNFSKFWQKITHPKNEKKEGSTV